MEKSQKRQVAHKIRINDVLRGSYVKEEGEWSPNYVLVGDKKVSRVNLMAVVVSKESPENTNHSNLLIDDGSGKISVRSFDGSNNFEGINIGDFIMIIGRPREYLNEKYIVSEILKKVENSKWVELRKTELNRAFGAYEAKQEENLSEKEVKEEIVVDDINSKIFQIIKEIDLGEGADTQDVITKSNIGEAENIITKLLERGEVFEIKPGKLKVLE
ncbi:MAG: hypothetical protein KKC75_04125 [Nanoarchaeota archaeon]|nr:hypothetical protein [Nanoarchaeota archaeon]MBU1004238.1 hypothetical protein [Nanoarchaeota archaeon]MBU1945875.1 hypothetical protein [Nanoarchaeota archaeon]